MKKIGNIKMKENRKERRIGGGGESG